MYRGVRAIVAVVVFGTGLLGVSVARGTTGPAPGDLKVDGQTNPLALAAAPHFSWLPHSTARGDVQSAYEIVVRDERSTTVVWDSGRVASSQESSVAYGGPRLADGHGYLWAVRSWNRAGQASPYSATANLTTGISDSEWSGAQWIRRVTTGNDSTIDYTLARGDFAVSTGSPVQRALVYVAAQGEWDLHVNGHGVDTQYDYQMPGEGFYAAEDVTSYVGGGPLTVAVKYGVSPTTEGESRPEGPVPWSTTLATAAPIGATVLHVGRSMGFAVRENLAIGTPGAADFDIAAIAAINGDTVTLTAPLPHAHLAGTPVVTENGPSGLLVKVVVEHADGTVQTFVSDGNWQVTKDTSEDNSVVALRSSENAGTYVEYVDARRAISGWDQVGYDDEAWHHAAPMGPHPLPNPSSCANYLSTSSPCGFTHLVPMLSKLTYQEIHPMSVATLQDGTVMADFGSSLVGVPIVHVDHGAAGRQVTLRGTYRLINSTTVAPAAPFTSVVSVANPCRFAVGDRITIDAPGDGYGVGDPEVRTVTAAHSGPNCSPGVVTLDRPLAHAHDAQRWVEGSRAGTSALDTQGTNLDFHYTETTGAQTTTFFVGQGLRYLQITGAQEPLSAAQIWVDATHQDSPADHAATFHSSNPMLDVVFALMQRSALYAGQQAFNDSPDRQDGQFLGDAVNESFAAMESLGERNLTKQAIANFAHSQQRYWLHPGPGSRSSYGDINAVYPDGDGKRDIPDFTEMFPEWVWRYYWLTGDRGTLALAYPTMQHVATYVADSIAKSGPAAGLVFQLVGGSNGDYQYGIVDWPKPMRYDTTVLNAGVSTVVNMRAVEVFRAVADAARVLGRTGDASAYDKQTRDLIATVNAKLIEPTGFYDDGLTPATGTQIGNHSEHDQTFALTYRVAPRSAYGRLGTYIATQGMKQGPLDLGQLEQALIAVDRPEALVALLTDMSADGPAKVYAEGGTSMWEQWDPGCLVPGGHPGDTTQTCVGPLIFQPIDESFSHGWGSVGIVGILRGLLGITVTSPGAASVSIAPPRVGLDSANGTEWTERGPLSVDWHKTAHGLAVTVNVPDNVTATVTLPGHAPVVVGSGRTTVSSG